MFRKNRLEEARRQTEEARQALKTAMTRRPGVMRVAHVTSGLIEENHFGDAARIALGGLKPGEERN